MAGFGGYWPTLSEKLVRAPRGPIAAAAAAAYAAQQGAQPPPKALANNMFSDFLQTTGGKLVVSTLGLMGAGFGLAHCSAAKEAAKQKSNLKKGGKKRDDSDSDSDS